MTILMLHHLRNNRTETFKLGAQQLFEDTTVSTARQEQGQSTVVRVAVAELSDPNFFIIFLLYNI